MFNLSKEQCAALLKRVGTSASVSLDDLFILTAVLMDHLSLEVPVNFQDVFYALKKGFRLFEGSAIELLRASLGPENSSYSFDHSAFQGVTILSLLSFGQDEELMLLGEFLDKVKEEITIEDLMTRSARGDSAFLNLALSVTVCHKKEIGFQLLLNLSDKVKAKITMDHLRQSAIVGDSGSGETALFCLSSHESGIEFLNQLSPECLFAFSLADLRMKNALGQRTLLWALSKQRLGHLLLAKLDPSLFCELTPEELISVDPQQDVLSKLLEDPELIIFKQCLRIPGSLRLKQLLSPFLGAADETLFSRLCLLTLRNKHAAFLRPSLLEYSSMYPQLSYLNDREEIISGLLDRIQSLGSPLDRGLVNQILNAVYFFPQEDKAYFFSCLESREIKKVAHFNLFIGLCILLVLGERSKFSGQPQIDIDNFLIEICFFCDDQCDLLVQAYQALSENKRHIPKLTRLEARLREDFYSSDSSRKKDYIKSFIIHEVHDFFVIKKIQLDNSLRSVLLNCLHDLNRLYSSKENNLIEACIPYEEDTQLLESLMQLSSIKIKNLISSRIKKINGEKLRFLCGEVPLQPENKSATNRKSRARKSLRVMPTSFSVNEVAETSQSHIASMDEPCIFFFVSNKNELTREQIDRLGLLIKDENLLHVFDIFSMPDDLLYLTGGVLRDTLADEPYWDFDFVTNLSLSEVSKRLVEKFSEAKIFSHKTNCMTIEGENFHVDMSCEHALRDLKEDALSRDFVCNTLYLRRNEKKQFELYEPLEGAIAHTTQRQVMPVSESVFRGHADSPELIEYMRGNYPVNVLRALYLMTKGWKYFPVIYNTQQQLMFSAEDFFQMPNDQVRPYLFYFLRRALYENRLEEFLTRLREHHFVIQEELFKQGHSLTDQEISWESAANIIEPIMNKIIEAQETEVEQNVPQIPWQRVVVPMLVRELQVVEVHRIVPVTFIARQHPLFAPPPSQLNNSNVRGAVI